MLKRFKKYKSSSRAGRIILVCLTAASLWWWNCLPDPLFNRPLATELLAGNGSLLGARIASDGQWRMEAADSISPRFFSCLVAFEDDRFYDHPGIDPLAFLRAAGENIRAGRVVSGGSTLTMQVARMIRGNRARNPWQKFLESLVALRLSLAYDKSEVLDLWANNAPFGGNIVGIEAACRKYFGRRPDQLSWAEAAVLAVLPNSPSLIRPGRSTIQLRNKRDALLSRLMEKGILDDTELTLALSEQLPGEPYPLPREAPHLLARMGADRGGRLQSTIEAGIQQGIAKLMLNHHRSLAGNQVFNLAVLVTEVATNNLVAYHGNVPGLADRGHAPDVDIITAPRSPGSLLKPILYAYALDAGLIQPAQWLPDVPTSFRNFRPANFYESFDGLVAADRALARSLNIPFVYLLRDYSVPKFYHDLKRNGFDKLSKPPDHYGLSLILGGGEITMEQYHAWFERTASQLNNYREYRQSVKTTSRNGLSAGAAFLTFEALRELRRPDELGAYHQFESHRPVAWKTGTSFGFRDAWAVGTTPAYTVSVWAGNADGEGRPGLVGVQAAAPLLFEIFELLEAYSKSAPRWFDRPDDELEQIAYCALSGFLASAICKRVKASGMQSKHSGDRCPYHRSLITDPSGTYRVRVNCEPLAERKPFLVIPAREAYFYRKLHPEYQAPPTWRDDCLQFAETAGGMQMIYPEGNGTLSPSVDWSGKRQPLHFQLAHARHDATVYWHLDERFIQATTLFHDLSLRLQAGTHKLTMVDDKGHRLERHFRIINAAGSNIPQED